MAAKKKIRVKPMGHDPMAPVAMCPRCGSGKIENGTTCKNCGWKRPEPAAKESVK